ncbi:MAG: protein kinase [Prevotella sp.]|nr:protein kinase [Prevotella sp.]
MEQELFDGKYRIEKRLGGGGFSDVWKVTYVKTDVTLALKIYKPGANVNNDGVEMLRHEYALMAQISHRNLLTPQFFDICEEQPYLVLPYCERGSASGMKNKMSEEEAWKLLRDIASALEYLHQRQPAIIHQDVKPDNILIAGDGTYMLTDFGVSTSLKVQTKSHVKLDENLLGSAGTLAYMPPNRFSRKNKSCFADDVWSLGATVYELLTGDLPFGPNGGLIQKKGADVPDLPEQYSNLLNETIRSCMDEDPALRPFASKLYEIACDALKHPEKLTPMSEDPNPTPIPTPELAPAPAPVVDQPQQSVSQPTISQAHSQPIPQSQPLSESNFYEEEPEDQSISKWIIVLGIIGGIAAGVLLALFV